MARLMSPIPIDKVNTTPIGTLRKDYGKLADAYMEFVETNMVVCPRCANPQGRNGFYEDKRNKTKLFCYCKECCKAMATDYNKSADLYVDNKDKAKFVLQLMDKPFIESLFNSTLAKVKEDLSQRVKTCAFPTYMRMINSLPNYAGMTWKDSTFDEDEEEIGGETKRITSTMKKRWGFGFTDNDYITMEEHYKMLKNNNPNADSNQEIFIEDLCRTRLLMLRAMKGEGKSDDFTKYSKTYQDTFRQAGLKTVAEVDASSEETLGVTLATISKYTPEEYYKDKKLYKDFDGLGDYVERLVLRPLRNLMTGSTDRDPEYSVPDTFDNMEG